MRIVLVCVLVALCVVPARSEDADGLWTKLKNAVKDFVNSMRDLFKELKEEIKARTSDISDWSKEMFTSFKTKMNEWVDEVKASESEKEDMRNYIERLEMPPKK